MKHLFAPGALALALLSAACTGPTAPDAAVCQDLIHRLCLAPRCPDVDTQLSVGDDCEATLRARTGCDSASFRFTTPSRDRVLACRDPLLREGDHTSDKPTCAEVDETLACSDVQSFLAGGAP